MAYTVSRAGVCDGEYARLLDTDSDNYDVVAIILESGEDVETGAMDEAAYARAHLFAAAPELLDACKSLVSLAPSAEGLGGHAAIGAFLTVAHTARAAIAKALNGVSS